MCDEVLFLDEQKREVLLKFLELKMHILAPNISAMIEPTIAAQLIACAGSLTHLAKAVPGNIQVFGKDRKFLAGKSTATAGLHRGYIANCQLVEKAPEAYKKNIIRMLCTKLALAARSDASRSKLDGSHGK